MNFDSSLLYSSILSEFLLFSDGEILLMLENPTPNTALKTCDDFSTQIALEAVLVAIELQGSLISDLRETKWSLEGSLSSLTALVNENLPNCSMVNKAIKISKQLLDTAGK